MIIVWVRFAAALVLLLTPIALFHGKNVRYRSIGRDFETYWPRIFRLSLHAIDAARSALGGWLLFTALSSDYAPHGILLRHGVILTQGTVLFTAITLQTFFCKDPDSANAPFAFLSGLLFGIYPPAVAGLPLLLAFAVAGGSRMAAAFFPALAVVLVGLGYLFVGKALLVKLLLGMCTVLLPWLYSLLFSRDLVITYRARRSTEGD